MEVDAAVVAAGLGLESSQLRVLMREGQITRLCERGVGEDAGRHRLTFYYRKRRLRLVIDGAGNIIENDRMIDPTAARPAGDDAA